MRLSNAYDSLSKRDDLPTPIQFVLLFLSAFLFQGMGYMDPTERRFKLGIDAICTTLFFFTLPGKIYRRVIAAILLAHSCNFLVNGQLFVFLKNFELIHTRRETFDRWLKELEESFETKKSVSAAVAYGSLSRGELSGTSDLDVRLIRRPGIKNAIEACGIVAMFRFKALLEGFPLDIYVLDGTGSLDKLRDGEDPTVLIDKEGIFR